MCICTEEIKVFLTDVKSHACRIYVFSRTPVLSISYDSGISYNSIIIYLSVILEERWFQWFSDMYMFILYNKFSSKPLYRTKSLSIYSQYEYHALNEKRTVLSEKKRIVEVFSSYLWWLSMLVLDFFLCMILL